MSFILFLWQAPQNLLALVLIVLFKGERAASYKGVLIYKYGLKGSVSLGSFILLRKDVESSRNTIKHEYGHCLQSRVLGPLYLLLIGVPSFSMNVLTRMRVLSGAHYYYRWPENWADRLGEVER